MGVVTKYGKSYKDPASIQLPPPVFAEGRVRAIVTGAIAVANGDSITSKHYLGKIPSSAIILPNSLLYHAAVTGLDDYDIGLERDGAVVSVNVLADGLDLTSAGSKSVIAKLATGSMGKRVYEVLGLSSDPGCEYDIVGTMNKAATASVSIEAFILYAKK